MIYILCILTSFFAIACILLPFFIGAGGKLSPHSAILSEEALEALQENLLKHYLKYEDLFIKGQLRKREWEQRQLFLGNRYIDATRRLDAVRFQKGNKNV